jgi:peptidyl-dipeptidase A
MPLKTFIDTLTKKIEAHELSMHHAWWNLAVTGEEKYVHEYEKAKIDIRILFSSKDDFNYLKSEKITSDANLERQRKILLHHFQENQIPLDMIKTISRLEGEIESVYTNFRPVVKGVSLSNNDLKNILVDSADSQERKEAWEASKTIGEKVEKDVLKLIALRNKSAQDAGFTDFYSMQLELQELTPSTLFELLEKLEKMTASAWKEYKSELDQTLADRFGIAPHHLMPWHYQDPFFQEAPKQNLDLDQYYADKDIVAISSAFYKAVGMPVEDVISRSDLFEREKKNQHAFCFCLDRKVDIRVLCNIRQNEYWMGTMLHELGHAVYDKYIDQSLPFILRTPSHILTTEASAMLFGRLSKNGDFLHQYVGLNKQKAEEIDLLSRQQTAANLLVFSRWVMVMVHFERAMYQEPDKDLNSYWWDLVERFQGVNRVPGRDKPDWASKLHLACAPVYYQNYLLGEMFASQLLEKLKQLTKDEILSSKQVGDFLTSRLYSVGATMPWDETITFATGEKLNPLYYANDIGIKQLA